MARRQKTYKQLQEQARRIMYNAGRQYGLGTDKQHNVRDKTKSIINRYGKNIDKHFAKKGIDVYGFNPVSRRVYMGLSAG